ncbi:heme/hemin ABC transporter substrate-binding protein [Agaribacter flavus]|uniref:Hemin ABC transporter substrate-binding protein n=1 Tax=Agaribacter flavus TaxID=1902781 RepID=A0ABV7FR24_9ALTE
MKYSFGLILLGVFLSVVNKDVYSQVPYAEESRENKGMKIVSAGGSVTEILYALDAQALIVATDTSSLYPAAVNQLPKVGYYRQLSVEGVASTGATHLISLAEAGSKTSLEQIKNLGVTLELIDTAKNIDGLYKAITMLGGLINKVEQAEVLIRTLRQDFAKVRKQVDTRNPKKAVFLMSISDQGVMAAGKNTVPNIIFKTLGMTNPYSQLQGFKTVSPESLLAYAPDLIFVPAHQARGLRPEQLCEKPAIRLLRDAYGCNLHIVDPLKFLGLTPRLPQAMQEVLEVAKKQQELEGNQQQASLGQ